MVLRLSPLWNRQYGASSKSEEGFSCFMPMQAGKWLISLSLLANSISDCSFLTLVRQPLWEKKNSKSKTSFIEIKFYKEDLVLYQHLSNLSQTCTPTTTHSVSVSILIFICLSVCHTPSHIDTYAFKVRHIVYIMLCEADRKGNLVIRPWWDMYSSIYWYFQTLILSFFIHLLYQIIFTILFLILFISLRVFSPMLADGFSPEFEWQVSSNLQDSVRSKKLSNRCSLLSSYFQVLLSLYRSFRNYPKCTNHNWYDRHLHVQ